MIKIPAIDLMNGQCVRLAKGDFNQSVFYDVNPVDLAQQYEDAGIKHIHIVDLDAARNAGSNKKVIHEIRKRTKLKIQSGGGIRTESQVDELLNMGIDSLIIGSVAQKEREMVKQWVSDYGSAGIIIGADVNHRKIAVDGWLKVSNEDISDFILEYQKAGATTFLCTDIQKDGMLSGTSNGLYSSLLEEFPGLQLIASGGVSSLKDLDELEAMDMYAVVIGKALFENKFSITEIIQK